MATTADFDQQVAIKLETFRDKYSALTVADVRVLRDAVADATEGETVFIGSSHEGGAASAQVVRDKLAMEHALNLLIAEKTTTAATSGTVTTLAARSLMTYPDYSRHDLVT